MLNCGSLVDMMRRDFFPDLPVVLREVMLHSLDITTMRQNLNRAAQPHLTTLRCKGDTEFVVVPL